MGQNQSAPGGGADGQEGKDKQVWGADRRAGASAGSLHSDRGWQWTCWIGTGQPERTQRHGWQRGDQGREGRLPPAAGCCRRLSGTEVPGSYSHPSSRNSHPPAGEEEEVRAARAAAARG